MHIFLAMSWEFIYILFMYESGSLQISQNEGGYKECPQNIGSVSNRYIFAIMRHNQMSEKLRCNKKLH
jgi:hypothetical protein